MEDLVLKGLLASGWPLHTGLADKVTGSLTSTLAPLVFVHLKLLSHNVLRNFSLSHQWEAVEGRRRDPHLL